MSTIRSTQYKMTELGPLPEEWRVVCLGDVAYVKQGRTPRREHYDDLTGYRIIKVKDFEDGAQVSVVPRGERSFTTIDLGDSVRVKAADILILNAGHSPQVVGQKVGIVPKALEGAFFVAELTVIRALQADPYFLFGVMMLPGTRNIIRSKVKGGHLYVSQLKTLPIPLPPLPEQRAIAYVLRTVQRAKEATDRVIAALKELKKSLMKHLFTYGPVPLDQADQVPLKETEIGPVPEHWEVVRLGEVANVKGGKRLPKGHKFSEKPTPYPYIRVVDFRNGTINKANLKFLTPEDYQLLKRYTISSKDVYISIAGTIGLVGVVPPDLDGANLTENAAKIVLNDKRLDQLFLVYALSSEQGQEQIHQRAAKTSQPKLALTRIRQIPIPLPPILEQREIARILQTIDRKIEAEENRKQALDDLFKTLLHNLMTAKIRVPCTMVERFADNESG